MDLINPMALQQVFTKSGNVSIVKSTYVYDMPPPTTSNASTIKRHCCGTCFSQMQYSYVWRIAFTHRPNPHISGTFMIAFTNPHIRLMYF